MSNQESSFWQEIQKELADDTKGGAIPVQMQMQNNAAQNIQQNNNDTNNQSPPYRLPFDNWNGANSTFPDIYDAPTGNPPPTQVLGNQDNIISILKNNLGYYVVCDFLIGTTGLETKEGILYSSGVNFLTLYHPQNETYTVCDIYSLKFITFYNSTVVPPERTGNRSGQSRNSSGTRTNRRFY